MPRSVYIIFKGGKDETLTGFVSFFYLHDTTRLLGRTERRRRKAENIDSLFHNILRQRTRRIQKVG
ncbi:hypothetical protein RBIBE_27550 [Bacillus velezensis]|nr:hypothetical protein RBIBE_27550 [Bacillus velezensis]